MEKHRLRVLLKYELLNTLGTFFTPFFGMVFPIVIGAILSTTITHGVPIDRKAEVATNIVMMMALIIPFSIMLVSFAAVFSQEAEQGVIKRLELFNFKDRDLMIAKIIIHYILITVSSILYLLVMLLVNQNLLRPKFSSFIIYLICFYLIATLLFIFAYAVATLLKKFGITYGITMTVYFTLMGLSGMMGPQPDQLPESGQKIAFSFPMAYISRDFSRYWVDGFSQYNFAPLIQSFIFMAAIVTLIYLFSWSRRRRKITN